jgi:serine protease DegS
MRNSIRFILQSIIVGLAAAAIILLVWPELLNESIEKSDQRYVRSYSDAVNLAAPAVVNIYASRIFQEQVNPLFQDPYLSAFFW